ncbi:imidazoleglycerol-phosphate dehydratase HisB [Brucepastera parasyntrophica]|uniref:imidazoleglycerol-phosphate dehydratase HisB n=1 Tax=Brucepastera parasyntrophica TaxID=2880008 RepID=UPI00210915A5|nr:imidazoleglycerol-phosphate dehydratase HisB [Brucepastera parasyntrophica]ULQ58904.1 imidazoleglycerol-phosphate dehydratase HisB [Brucepastera parasyntrophica]
MERLRELSRKTAETNIQLKLNLDGTGIYKVDCPLGFLSHMLHSFCRHGLFDLTGSLAGDLEVDQHHLVEDTGIVLGQLFHAALGEKKGIRRAGFFMYPMDETLSRCAVDFGGRPFLVYEADLSGAPLISKNPDNTEYSFQTDTIADFWQGFVSGAQCNMHIDIIRGRSDHHKIEAVFKSAARALREAVSLDPRAAGVIPSTKGVL